MGYEEEKNITGQNMKLLKRIKAVGSGILYLSCLMLFISSLGSCKDSPAPFASEGITTYSEATKWVKENYKGETVTPISSKIYKMVYFPKGKYMLIHFKSNKRQGYLYHRVSSSLWNKFKNASSVDDFYKSKIKGNKTIYLKLQK